MDTTTEDRFKKVSEEASEALAAAAEFFADLSARQAERRQRLATTAR